jgi:hypothetical protein
MSNGKSGFEIRADLLNQAQGLLEGNLYRENEKIDRHNEVFPNDKKSLGDQFVSVEEVISTARQLNEFVNEK